MNRRVVITGMGVISSVGNDVQSFWNSLVNGVIGIDEISDFPTEQLPVKIAGTIKNFNGEDYGMDKGFVRKQDKFVQYAMAAAVQAMNESGLITKGDGLNIDPFRLGVYVGSGLGGYDTQFKESMKMVEDPSGRWVSPLMIPTIISNMAAGQIAIRFNACGPCLDVVTACASSSHSIGEAYRAIKHGYSDAIIAGGCEHMITPLSIAGFANAKALSRAENPKYASLPFSADREGFVLGDGAGIIILEALEHAEARGARIFGEIVGYGNTCDAWHSTAPRSDGSTQSRAIVNALKEANYDETRDTLYINAHGTGTKLNDSTETLACKLALGEAAYKAHITSIKSMTGHMLGAAGGAEAITTIMSLNEGLVTPTVNLTVPDPECDLNYTPCTAVKTELSLGISNSFGFGGHNACLAFRKYKR